LAVTPIGAGTLGDAYANIANYVPEVWSTLVLAEAESQLVCVKCVDRKYETGYSYGDVVHVADLLNISATEVNTSNDATLYDTVQNKTDITINQWYHAGVSEPDAIRKMSRPDYLKLVTSKLGYALAKQMDTSVNALFNAFTQNVGTEGAALTDDVLLKAKEYLDLADAPQENRVLIIDPESLTDLLKIDKFVRMDYVPGGVVQKGMVGRIYGCDVFTTTNLTAINTSYHAATMMHKEAIAMIVAMEPRMTAFRDWKRFSDGIMCDALWGLAEMRDTFGVWIKTRS
jgi:N4-gp56 family major capsid protein